MKYDFSKPLTEEQMEVVRWTQENGDDAVKAGEYFDMDPATVFKWTIQDYEEQRQPLMKQGFEEMTDELLHQINSIYECEVNLRKTWEDYVKDQKEKQQA